MPNPYGTPFIGSIYFGSKADVEKIPDEFDFSEPEPTEPEPTEPEPTEPAVPGGQGRWVLLDNFEGGKISDKKYSVNDNYKAVTSDRFGNYSAYNDGTGGYLKYDQDVPGSDYETPAIGFWAKGTEGAQLMFWGKNPLGSVTLHEEWTYYVWTGGLKSQINNNGGNLDYINMWSGRGAEVWLDQIYFGEKEDLEVAPDLAEGYDFYQILPGEEPDPEYESSDKVVIYSKEGFETGEIPEGAVASTMQGAILWEIYDYDRLLKEYYDMLTMTWGSYCLTVREDTQGASYTAGQKNKGVLTMPVFEVSEETDVKQLAITFQYMTKYNRDESVNRWQILPNQNQNLTLEVSGTGDAWTEIWNLNKDMDDDLFNGCWYSVSAPVDAKFLSQGKLYYRFVYESNGGNQLALDDILVEEYIAPLANEELDVIAYKIYDSSSGSTRRIVEFNTADTQKLTYSDAPGEYNGNRYSAMEYYNGMIYAVVQRENRLVALDPYTFEVQEVIAERIGNLESNLDIYGMTYDPSRDVFYIYQQVMMLVPGGFELFEMDPDTGECTLLLHWDLNMAPSFDGVACDKNGNLYAMTAKSLYKFDFTNPGWNEIEGLNLHLSNPWVGSLSINKETGILYYAPFSGMKYSYGHLYAVDPNTARATKIGTVGNCSELAAIVIPYENGVVERYTITSTVGKNGNITPAGEVKVREGKNRSFTVTPDVGYEVDTLTIDGVTVDLTTDPNWDGFSNKYTFQNVGADHTIEVTFKVATFTVTFTDYDGKVLSTQTVDFGKSATAPAAPTREGYTFAGWDKDFTQVYDNLTIRATYAVNVYRVIFLNWNGKILDVQYVRHQKSAEAPEAPAREGYTFTGWDKDFTNVTADLVVTAQYTKDDDPVHEHTYEAGEPVYIGNHTVAVTYTCPCGTSYTETQTIECPSAKFTDLTAKWYHEEVDEALWRGLFVGVSETTFQPGGKMTRGQFVTVLYRMAGSPAVTGTTPFTDVKEGSYYASAVAWAYTEGYVKGVTDTTFCPDAVMSREMVVTILWRMEGAQASGQSLDAFDDADSVSGYAKTAMAWAVEQGLIRGVSDTSLAPGASITRAQGAVLLIRYAHAFVD